VNLNLTDDQVVMVIAALHYYARMEAGQTQAPTLCEPADYEQHDLAVELQRRFDRSKVLRNQWVTDPQTGDTVRRT
jgi:hypothetical protein